MRSEAEAIPGRDPASALHEQIIAPFAAELDGVQTLYLAPDSILSTAPIDRFRLPDGRYLAERFALRLLPTGRDLLREPLRDRPKGLLALGGLDFDGTTVRLAQAGEGEAAEVRAATREAGARLMRDMKPFGVLGSTPEEVGRIAALYRSWRGEPAEVLDLSKGSEAALKGRKAAPRVLHFATHGFYLNAGEGAEETEPMVLSGVALAGANRVLRGEKLADDEEDGILYALEAQGLDLDGTELVVLSACETGQGAVDYSEGVFGLVRAFQIAEVERVLMTLTPVGDAAAKDFVVRFYEHWLGQGGGRSDPAAALRATKLEYIRSTDAAKRDPKVWSPWVMVGG